MHIATGSSKEFVSSFLQKHKISKYFSKILTGDVIHESKPNPKIYLEMNNLLQSREVVVIEDSPAGVQSAKKAGLFVLGLGYELGADREFANYKEIIDYFTNP